jgi:hypothetical protein
MPRSEVTTPPVPAASDNWWEAAPPVGPWTKYQGSPGSGLKPVTDPELLKILNAPDEPENWWEAATPVTDTRLLGLLEAAEARKFFAALPVPGTQ